MKNIILFDDDFRENFLPLVYHRPVGELKIGAMQISEKWQYYSKDPISYITQDYLADKYSIYISDDNILVNARLMPNKRIIRLISDLDYKESLMLGDQLLAIRLGKNEFKALIEDEEIGDFKGIDIESTPVEMIKDLTDLFRLNGLEIQKDYDRLTFKRESKKLDSTNTLIGDPKNLFIEQGARVRNSSINVENGPVYIGSGAEVMEQCMIRGPLVLSQNATLKMGSKIYGPTTIGKHSKVGGEVNNSIVMDYSNKGHDGFIGNSVIGTWCNLGADTNCSNLKNNYGNVKQWRYGVNEFVDTGKQFVGMVMGDFSKCGINSMFNTATVIGVASNIFGAGFPQKFIPSFSFGGPEYGWNTNEFEKALDSITAMMTRRGKELTEQDVNILAHVHEITRKHRRNFHV